MAVCPDVDTTTCNIVLYIDRVLVGEAPIMISTRIPKSEKWEVRLGEPQECEVGNQVCVVLVCTKTGDKGGYKRLNHIE